MEREEYFWKASVNELKQGFFFDTEAKAHVCLICGKSFEDGVIYPVGTAFYTARKAVEAHVLEEHGDLFEYFLGMGKTYTGLTENQKSLMQMMHSGMADREIAVKTGVSGSTVRNQRFSFREKYKQAKIVVALAELLEEGKKRKAPGRAASAGGDELVEFHRTAGYIDDRYNITAEEQDKIIGQYFSQENRLKHFPVKEKKKVIIMRRIMKAFDAARQYTEREVNDVIETFFDDYTTIRRYLIQYGFLDRKTDGSTYWVKR